MTNKSLKFINDLISEVVDYQFMEWNADPVPDPYFVGEFTEDPSSTLEEDGHQDSEYILTGTGTGWLSLVNAQNEIRKLFPKTAILENGDGIAVFYENAIPIPTGDAELKRIQINLTIKEWRVN